MLWSGGWSIKMKKIIAIIAFAALLALLTGCGDKKSKDEQAVATAEMPATANDTPAIAATDTATVVTIETDSTFVDKRDGKKYKKVKIGTQVWMAENLNYEAKNSKCYDDKPANCNKYGRLYDWNTAMKTCPSGWHLPSDDEWYVLTATAGDRHAGGKLKSKNGWNKNNGTDDFGFSAFPGGGFFPGDGFANVEFWGRWWSSTYDGNRPKSRGMDSNYDMDMDEATDRVLDISDIESHLYSVRCVEGEASVADMGAKEAKEEETGPVYLLTEMDIHGDVTKFEYDDQNRITKITNGTYVKTITYNNDGELDSYVYAHGKNFTYKRNGNKITVYDGKTVYGKIDLNAEGLPKNEKYTGDCSDCPEQSINREYENGNMTAVRRQDDWFDNYTYDNKKSPFYHCKTPKWFLLAFLDYDIKNNTLTNYAWFEYSSTLDSASYTYNEAGFPLTQKIKKKATYEEGGDEKDAGETTTTYKYKFNLKEE